MRPLRVSLVSNNWVRRAVKGLVGVLFIGLVVFSLQVRKPVASVICEQCAKWDLIFHTAAGTKMKLGSQGDRSIDIPFNSQGLRVWKILGGSDDGNFVVISHSPPAQYVVILGRSGGQFLSAEVFGKTSSSIFCSVSETAYFWDSTNGVDSGLSKYGVTIVSKRGTIEGIAIPSSPANVAPVSGIGCSQDGSLVMRSGNDAWILSTRSVAWTRVQPGDSIATPIGWSWSRATRYSQMPEWPKIHFEGAWTYLNEGRGLGIVKVREDRFISEVWRDIPYLVDERGFPRKLSDVEMALSGPQGVAVVVAGMGEAIQKVMTELPSELPNHDTHGLLPKKGDADAGREP